MVRSLPEYQRNQSRQIHNNIIVRVKKTDKAADRIIVPLWCRRTGILGAFFIHQRKLTTLIGYLGSARSTRYYMESMLVIYTVGVSLVQTSLVRSVPSFRCWPTEFDVSLSVPNTLILPNSDDRCLIRGHLVRNHNPFSTSGSMLEPCPMRRSGRPRRRGR